ncbi:MAG: hypothetical protein IPH71_07440 [Proteobacteria bacterium]|mgnify:CR=1 FL=1|jgi:hypothetical protein|nr:hypothetical protein [Pseudomonadota bacterium]
MRKRCLAALALFLLSGVAHSAIIEDAAWLAGRWTGSGLGGQLEEVWSPPAGGQMVGHFRLVQDGKPVFYEFILLDVVEGGVRMRLKHFNPDHTAWEDKDAWTTFSPVSASKDKLVFSALTIERTGADTLTMTLKLRQEGKVVEETLKFQRTAP